MESLKKQQHMRLSTRHFDAQNANSHICKTIEEGEGNTKKTSTPAFCKELILNR